MSKTSNRMTTIRILLVLLIALFISCVWRSRHLIQGTAIAAVDLVSVKQASFPTASALSERLVAHAGGAVHGRPYTNSREALDQHYAEGYRIFELDFHWTSDGRLVLVHDWLSASKDFGVAAHVFTYSEFVHARRRDGLRQMTFEDLRQWLQIHRDAFVVTDTKDDNPRLLAWLLRNGSDICPQLIIQIYRLTELDSARRLHPRAVWLTVYRYDYPGWALSQISAVDAFVVPVEKYSRYASAIASTPVHFYVHSVRMDKIDDAFRSLPGIYGIYVD